MNEVETILWQRLDVPGHDIASISTNSGGCLVAGVAVFVDADRPCRVDYEIRCGADWTTQRCVLRGLLGANAVHLDIQHTEAGSWSTNGREITAVRGCRDVDLGFSPVTNLFPIRRLALNVGERADVNAAWVRFPELTVELLEQTYTRIAGDRYLYESAGGSFRRELTVDPFGCVVDYPGLWRAESTVQLPGAAL